MSDLIERLRRLYVQTGMNYVQEAADEIEHLRAEVQRRREHIAVFDERYTQLEAERDELRRQLAEAELDAQRYRWLRGSSCPDHSRRWTLWEIRHWRAPFWTGDLRHGDLDAAIDAQIEQEQTK